MKKQATKLLESLVAAGLTPEQAELSIQKAIADGTCDDDRNVQKAINDDDFNAALEKIAKAVEKKDDITKSVTAEAEKAAAKVDAAVSGEKVAQPELNDIRSDVKVAIEKAQRSADMLESALPGFRDMFVVVAGAIENLSKAINARLDNLEQIQKSVAPARGVPAPRSMQVAGRVAPAPGDGKSNEKDPVVLRKSIFDKIRAETVNTTTTPKRHHDLAKASAVLTSMTTADVLSQLATELGYSDLLA